MKTKLFILTIATLAFTACGNNAKEGTVDNTDSVKSDAVDATDASEPEVTEPELVLVIDQGDPEKVVEAIFSAAQTGNYSGLSGLCAPDADGDCKKICGLATASAGDQQEFKDYFAKGIVTNTEVNVDKATVDIQFGPNGDKKEKIQLVMIGKKWFIRSF